ncbi:hypothetical protein BC351_22980 [Paenibacillus ferrarius]|uniref:Uncharacterized protein n=1 Tax=Paenibacillus ferrarius TaxID=1469647 RepID=A0A1V4HMD0_9BACL|nr:hypothetical protein BC351_22980 [Paenibacillus ferrarius]
MGLRSSEAGESVGLRIHERNCLGKMRSEQTRMGTTVRYLSKNRQFPAEMELGYAISPKTGGTSMNSSK